MTSKPLTITVRDLCAVIDEAFHGADACHCQTVAKLGEQEILDHLARRGLVPIGIGRLSIAGLVRDGLFPPSIEWALRGHRKVRHLTDLTEFSYADVSALDRIGRKSVNQLETTMARFGLALKGADPALLKRPPEPEPDNACQGLVSDPQEVRQNTFRALMKLGNSVLRDGASLVRIAAMVGAGHPQARVLRHYLSHGTQSCRYEVAAIVGPLLDLDDQEKQAQKPAKARRRRLPAPAAVEPDNVIAVGFRDAKSAAPSGA